VSAVPHKVAGIILAAGESRRMGRPKALLPFRGGTFLSVLAGTFANFCDPVIAIFGFDAENVRKSAPPGVLPVVNPNYRDGMLTSLQAGLRACGDSFDAVLFTLVDHPAIKQETISALLGTDAAITIPRFRGRRGHPVFISREICQGYLSEPADSKVRDIIDRHAGLIRYVDVDDAGICDDIDDPALYAALLARDNASHEGAQP